MRRNLLLTTAQLCIHELPWSTCFVYGALSCNNSMFTCNPLLQKRAVRLINFAPFLSHAVPYFLHSNIMPVTMLYFKLSSILMFDVYNNIAPIIFPISLFLLKKSTLTVLVPPLLEIITSATLD